MTDPNIVAELRAALLALGVAEAEIASMDLDSLPVEAIRSVIAAASIPDEQKARTGIALVLDTLMRGDRRTAERALHDVLAIASQAALREAGPGTLAMVIATLATAAAIVLPEDDERTPADFLRVVMPTLEVPDMDEKFADLKASFHATLAYGDIQADLDRIVNDPDALDGLLS